jgi:hypothetical protein
MPEELQPGASFSEIAEAPVTAEAMASTPAEGEQAASVATEGDTKTEPETLGVLKEPKEDDKAQEGEDKPDLSLDADLEKHPILKAKWEAYVANKEKGIDKFIHEHNEKLKEATSQLEQWNPLVEFYNEFENPETVDAAFQKMCVGLAKTYGRSFGGFDAAGQATGQATATPQTQGEPKDGESKYGFEFASEDKILETTVKVVEDRIAKLLDQRLEPISKKFETDEQAAATRAAVEAALPALKSTYEVSADPWVTPEKVTEAMREYPGLTPDKAFRAHFADHIARYSVKHSQGKQPVKNLPLNNNGGTTRAELRPGATFGDIAMAEATL